MTIASRRLLIFVSILVGGACVTLSLFGSFVRGEQNRLAPPEGVDTLDDFAESMPAPTKLAIVEESSTTYVVWIGEYATTWLLPSGPSCYVFDDAGDLLDWDWITGDGQSTTRLCELAWAAEALTVDEAIEFVRGNTSPKTSP
jgi:hypothetical protein